MRKITIAVIIALLTTALIFAGPAKESKNASTAKALTITMGYWGDSGETDAYKKAMEGIEKAIPGVKVVLQHYPSTADFWNSLPGQIAAGTAPDIIAPTNENHLSYIASGLFLPLTKYQFDMSPFSKNATDSWTYNGEIYGIPITASPAVFAVNKDMWKAAGLGAYPKTWEEVEAAAKVLTTKNTYGICIDLSQGYHMTQYMNSFGGGWKNGQGINSKANSDALTYIFKMYKSGYAVNPKDLGLGWDGEVFAGGKAAMTTAGTWYIGFMKAGAPNIDYDLIPVPSGNGKEGSTLHSIAYTILKSSKNPEVAAQVAYYMASESGIKAYAEYVGGKPSRSTLDDFYYELNPKMKALKPAVQHATSFGYPIEAAKFQDDLVKSVENIIYTNNKNYTATSAQTILDTLATTYK